MSTVNLSTDTMTEIEPKERTAQEREQKIAAYEAMFGMSSEQFLQEVEEGRRPDSFEAMDWASLLRYR